MYSFNLVFLLSLNFLSSISNDVNLPPVEAIEIDGFAFEFIDLNEISLLTNS